VRSNTSKGLIQRTELTVEQSTQLAAVTEPPRQTQVSAEAKIWQETLTILAQLRYERPHDRQVIEEWQELLNSV